MTMRTLSIPQYVRSLALDTAPDVGEVMTDDQINIIVGRLRDPDTNMVDLLDVALEYCRAGQLKNADQVPERARMYQERESFLLRERLASGDTHTTSSMDGITIVTSEQLPVGRLGQVLVYGTDWGAGQVSREGIQDNAIGPTKIDDDAILRRHIAENAVGLDQIAAASIIPNHLNSGFTAAEWAAATGLLAAQLQVDWNATTGVTSIANKPAIVRAVDALPSTVVDDEVVVVAGRHHYIGRHVSGPQAFRMTVGNSLSQQGFDRASGLGSISPDLPWLQRFWHNDDTQQVEMILLSTDAPGNINQTGISGRQPLTQSREGSVVTTADLSAVQRTYTLTTATGPFAAATVDMVLTPTNPLSYWRVTDVINAIESTEVQDWAKTGNTDRVPYTKTNPRVLDSLTFRDQANDAFEVAVYEELFTETTIITGAAMAALSFTPNQFTALPGVTWVDGEHYDFWNDVNSPFVFAAEDILTSTIATAGATVIPEGQVGANAHMRYIAEGGIVDDPREQIFIGRTATNQALIAFSSANPRGWNIDRLNAASDGRLLPATANDGQTTEYRTGRGWTAADVPETVQTKITADITTHSADEDAHHTPPADWAEEGNTDIIPTEKLPPGEGLTAVSATAPLEGAGTTADPLNVGDALGTLSQHVRKGGWTNSTDIRISVRTPRRDLSGAESLVYSAVVQHTGPNSVGEGYYLEVPAAKATDLSVVRTVGDDSEDSGHNVAQFLVANSAAIVREGASADGTTYLWFPENSLQGGNSVSTYHYRAQENLPLELEIDVPVDDIDGLAAVGKTNDYRSLDNLPNLQDGRVLFNGTLTGVSITSLDADSAVAVTNLTEALNLSAEPHGVLLSFMTPTLSGFAASDVTIETETNGVTSLDAVARAAVYLSTTTDLGFVLTQADVMKGSVLAGTLVVKMARQADGGTLLTEQYLPHQGHALKDSGNASTRYELELISAGVPRGAGSGQMFTYDQAALPDADDFNDGDYVWMIAANALQGVYLKESEETHVKADTGLGGLTLDPSSDLVSTDDGAYDVDRFNRVTFTGPGGNTIAVDTSGWSAAPADLSYIYLSYRSRTRDNGSVVIKFSSNRTYTGAIVIRAGSHAIRINGPGVGQQTDTWRYDGLDTATVAALRENDWTFSEPDMTGYKVTHTLKRVVRGADAPITGVGVPSILRPTWSGNVSLAATGANGITAYTDMQTFTLPAGTHLALMDILLAEQVNNVISIRYRIQKSGVTVWEDGEFRKTDLAGPGRARHGIQAVLEGAGSYVLQVRAFTPTTGGSPYTWSALNQEVTFMTWS